MIDFSIDGLYNFVIEQLKSNQFFQTAGFFGLLSFILVYLKYVPVYLWVEYVDC